MTSAARTSALLGKLDLPRPSGDARARGAVAPFASNTRSATRAMSVASTAYTRRAPARAAATARTPVPVPDVEHDVARLHTGGEPRRGSHRSCVGRGASGHAPPGRPATYRCSAGVQLDQAALLDQHVDSARRVGAKLVARQRARARGELSRRPAAAAGRTTQDGDASRADVDDGADRRVDQDVTGGVPSRAGCRRELQHGLGTEIDVVARCSILQGRSTLWAPRSGGMNPSAADDLQGHLGGADQPRKATTNVHDGSWAATTAIAPRRATPIWVGRAYRVGVAGQAGDGYEWQRSRGRARRPA